jgi:flagellar motility protein MotE (MotC chaperone)
MAAEADKKKETPKPEEAAQAQTEKSGKSGKSGLVKYLLFGGIGLVAVVGIAFGTLFLVGGGSDAPATAETPADSTAQTSDSTAHAVKPAQAKNTPTVGDSTTEAEDLAALVANDTSLAFLDPGKIAGETIVSNLEALDHSPAENDLTAAESSMTTKDSLAAVDWLSQEKTKLAEREKDLDTREKDIKVRESKIQQGITRIEQAESSRTAKLAGLYDGMDASAVAKLVANLDDETVVALLPRMKPKNASAVLALMPPARAAKLSQQMVSIAEN